jgi:hypothetical protein
MKGILDLVSIILEREVLWVPVLLLMFNQVLKVSFSLLKVLNNTLKELFLTLGAELCVLGISIHVSLLAKSDSAFAKHFPLDKQASAAVILLVIYFALTSLSLAFLKFATNQLHRTISDKSKYRAHIMKIGLFIGLSFSFGLMLFLFVVSTV